MAKYIDEGRMHTVEGELVVKRRGQSAVRHTTAKAGMQAGDIQKEAHLSFYLGMVFESNKNH